MDRDALQLLVAYQRRANARILETTALLTDDELRRPAPLDYDSAFETLLHIAIVDWSWRDFCVSMDDEDDSYPEGWPPEDLPSIDRFCREEDEQLVEYVATLTDEALSQPVTWKGEDGDIVTHPRAAILLHIVNHATQHRSELARYLTDCGHSPGDLDLL